MNKDEKQNLHREKIRLDSWHRRFVYTATYLIWGSGAVWVAVYLRNAIAAHPHLGQTPTQIWSMKIHGALAMLYLFVCGTMIFHVRRGLALRVNTPSGIAFIIYLLTLICTGWILYYVGTESVRNVSSLLHWILGLGAPLFLLLHVKMGRG